LVDPRAVEIPNAPLIIERIRPSWMVMEMEIVMPEQVPVMTLPETAFFPQALLPLHIFEPRYRQMVRDVLAHDRLFAVAGLDPRSEAAEEKPHTVATIGVVRACQAHADGTSNLLLQGLARVQIMGIAREEPYRLIKVKVLASHAGADQPANAKLRSRLVRLIARRIRLDDRVPVDFAKFLKTVDDPETFVDLATFALCEHAGVKQRLLETLDVNERLRLFGRHLRQEVARLELQQRLQGPLADGDISRN
jgi:Lon protease-like protein